VPVERLTEVCLRVGQVKRYGMVGAETPVSEGDKGVVARLRRQVEHLLRHGIALVSLPFGI